MLRGDRVDPRPCQAWDCDRHQQAKGLCMMHYKRERRGVDVRTRPDKIVGDKSGHGLYGVLDDDGATVLCHECGQRFRSVGAHLGKGAHDMTVTEYRARHGLGRRTALHSAALSAEQSARARLRLGSAEWQRFEAARDPAAASAARDMDEIRAARAEVRTARAERAAETGRSTRRGQVIECVMCGASWCQVGGARQPQTCSYECWTAWQSAVAMTEVPPNSDRDRAIRQAHAGGESTRSLASRYGLTAQRIRQIVYGRSTD